MAGKVFEAGIRFNGEQFKYAKMVFDVNTMTCTMYIDIINHGVPTRAMAGITASQWVPVKDEDTGSDPLLSVEPTRATKTTAKKAVKESK